MEQASQLIIELREFLAKDTRAAVNAPLLRPIYIERFFDLYTRLHGANHVSDDNVVAVAVNAVREELVERRIPGHIFSDLTVCDQTRLRTFRATNAWYDLLRRSAEEEWDPSQVDIALAEHAAAFGTAGAGTDELGAAPIDLLRLQYEKSIPVDLEQVISRLSDSEEQAQHLLVARDVARRRAGLSESSVRLADVIGELTVFRLEVREAFTEAAHESYPVFEAVYANFHAQGHPQDLFRQLTREQVLRLAQGEQLDVDHVAEQYRWSTMETSAGGLCFAFGFAAHEAFESWGLTEEFKRGVNPLRSLRGTVGNTGSRIVGRALVVPSELDFGAQTRIVESQLQPGDVLIIGMTFPSVVPHCRGAAAIVTDFGGATAHAVLVAREYGIPCLVGTNSATHTFNSGDVVVVDTSQASVEMVVSDD